MLEATRDGCGRPPCASRIFIRSSRVTGAESSLCLPRQQVVCELFESCWQNEASARSKNRGGPLRGNVLEVQQRGGPWERHGGKESSTTPSMLANARRTSYRFVDGDAGAVHGSSFLSLGFGFSYGPS